MNLPLATFIPVMSVRIAGQSSTAQAVVPLMLTTQQAVFRGFMNQAASSSEREWNVPLCWK